MKIGVVTVAEFPIVSHRPPAAPGTRSPRSDPTSRSRAHRIGPQPLPSCEGCRAPRPPHLKRSRGSADDALGMAHGRTHRSGMTPRLREDGGILGIIAVPIADGFATASSEELMQVGREDAAAQARLALPRTRVDIQCALCARRLAVGAAERRRWLHPDAAYEPGGQYVADLGDVHARERSHDRRGRQRGGRSLLPPGRPLPAGRRRRCAQL